jgi:hypothetical protein
MEITPHTSRPNVHSWIGCKPLVKQGQGPWCKATRTRGYKIRRHDVLDAEVTQNVVDKEEYKVIVVASVQVYTPHRTLILFANS